MTAWLTAHATAFGTALRRLVAHPFAAFFEVLVLGIALSLPVGLFAAIETARGFADQHRSEPEISVYVELGTAPPTVESLRRKLTALPDVASVTFVSRQDAAKTLRQSAGMAEVLDALPENPLPDAFILRLATLDATRLEAIKAAIGKWPGIALAQADSGWVRKVETGIQVARTAAMLLAALFGLAAVTVTFNTVRLQMLGRRDEIQLSRLIGATDAFIRRPFLWFGALQGLLGGAAALAIVAGAGHALAGPIGQFSIAYGARVVYPPPPPGLLAGFIGATAALGVIAAWIAATRHLWARQMRRD